MTHPEEAEARVRQAESDRQMVAAIASHLRDHPADPYSGRQCEEMVLSLLSMLDEARDESSRWALRFADVRWASGVGVKPMLSEVPDAIRAKIEGLESALAEERGRVAEWKEIAMPYIAIWATNYARERSLPDGHLYPDHYDNLAATGARMDDFTRATMGDRQ